MAVVGFDWHDGVWKDIVYMSKCWSVCARIQDEERASKSKKEQERARKSKQEQERARKSKKEQGKSKKEHWLKP